MGGNHSDQVQTFQRQDWAIVQRTETSSTWQNLRDPTQRIEQFVIFSASQQDYKHERQMYYMRKNHPQVVAALYLSSDTNHDFCSSSYQQKLYIQKIPIRLADIEHVPFPDYLHIYSQALKGYAFLSTQVGYFPVEEDYIGINQRSVVKVWMNPDLSQSAVIGHRVTQEVMVRTIIEIIDKNLDRSQVSVPSVKDYIYRTNNLMTFQHAIAQLNNFIQQYNGGITPTRLQCIDKVGGIYKIANRQRSIHQQVIHTEPQQIIPEVRPRLVDSQTLSNLQFPINTYNPPQNRPVIQSSQIIPNSQNHILTPSNVRQNIPIVRRENPLVNNNVRVQQQAYIPPPIFYPVQNNNFIRQQYPIQPQSQSFVFKQFPQAPSTQSVIIQRSPVPIPVPNNSQRGFYLQNTTINVQQNSNQPFPQSNSNQLANNLNNMIISQKDIIINNDVPSIPFPQFRLPAQNLQNNEGSRQINSYTAPSAPQVNPQPNNAINLDLNQKQTIESSVKTVNLDDGKSPSDFFSRLNAFSSVQPFKGLNYQSSSNEPANNKTYEQSSYSYNNAFNSASQNIVNFQTRQSNKQNYNQTQQQNGEQNFGKSAVSNIVQGYQSNYSSDKIRQPLRFQNNLDMKYSIFQTEGQPKTSYGYSYNEGYSSYDPQGNALYKN